MISKIPSFVFLAVLSVLVAGCRGEGFHFTEKQLDGHAEDLWGEAVDLSDYTSGLTVLHPFSPSNCGYCLFDEELLYTNYGLNTIERGGSFLGMSLFATQLDNYTYQKHYRESSTILTWPPDLHRYHKDGFPWISAFRNGERVFSGWPSPYEEQFVKLRTLLWGEEIPFAPTSNLQMATRFIYENKANLAVVVIPDGAKVPGGSSTAAYSIVSESDLTGEDIRKNLLVKGRSNSLKLEFLKGQTMPVAITSAAIAIGDYEFPREKVGLNACFPNPHNPERYIVLEVVGGDLTRGLFQNWTDYTVYGNGPDGTPDVLLAGLFDRKGSAWKFSARRAWVNEKTASFCKGGKCPAPVAGGPAPKAEPYEARAPRRESTPAGEMWTLGRSGCRFPNACADGRGGCVVVWEEGGDIISAMLSREGEAEIFPVEDGSADCFNPVVTAGDRDTWVFYLANRDGFYRLCGSYGRLGGALNEVRISGDGAADCVTPDVVSDGSGGVVVAWSEWRANQRFLQYRRIDGRMLGEIGDVKIKSSDIDYTNGWYPSLAIDSEGAVWGAWNQHYPITLGVYAGNLTEEAAPVSDDEGAYPSIVIGRDGRRWVFWESYMWDVLKGKAQRILAAYSDKDQEGWSLPDDVSSAGGCRYNRTPEGVIDADGDVWVAWSGRADDTSPWGVYLSRRTAEGWSEPLRVSPEGESARAPSVCAGTDGALWLSWHAGTGSGMKVKVLRYNPA